MSIEHPLVVDILLITGLVAAVTMVIFWLVPMIKRAWNQDGSKEVIRSTKVCPVTEEFIVAAGSVSAGSIERHKQLIADIQELSTSIQLLSAEIHVLKQENLKEHTIITERLRNK